MKKIASLLIVLTLITSTPILAAPIEVRQQNLATSILPKNAVRVPFLKIYVSASETNQSLKTLTLQRTGLSSREDLGRIWAETNTYRRSNSRQLSNDDQVQLTFRNPVSINTEEPLQVTIYANMSAENGNRTIGLSLLSINDQFSPEAAKAEPKISSPSIKTKKTSSSSKSPYDRTKFRIKCKNSRCKLVPRS